MNWDVDTLNRLVSLVQDGDPDSLAALLKHAHPYMVAFVSRQLPECFKMQVAEDIVQEAYLKALQNLSDPKVSGSRWENANAFFAWLRKVIDNHRKDWLDYVTRDKRDIRRTINERQLDEPAGLGAGFLAEAAYHEDTPSKQARHAERDALLLAAIKKYCLPQEQEAIQLYHRDGLSLAEAAAIMGCSSDAVRDLAWRGRKKLRAALCSSQFLSSR